MSESPVVLVGLADNEKAIKQQNYDRLSLVYNPSPVSSIQIESDFYNSIPSISHEADLYGFLPTQADFTFDYSIEKIIKFFMQDDLIDIVICDLIHQYKDFVAYEYVQAATCVNNVPLFIRNSLKDKITFGNEEPILQKQIITLQQQGHTIFHIAEPLVTINKEGNG
jgi:hypothetical protein